MKKLFDYLMPSKCKSDFEIVRAQAAVARQNVLELFTHHQAKIIKEISTPSKVQHG